jgi:hypothetical protein
VKTDGASGKEAVSARSEAVSVMPAGGVEMGVSVEGKNVSVVSTGLQPFTAVPSRKAMKMRQHRDVIKRAFPDMIVSQPFCRSLKVGTDEW